MAAITVPAAPEPPSSLLAELPALGSNGTVVVTCTTEPSTSTNPSTVAAKDPVLSLSIAVLKSIMAFGALKRSLAADLASLSGASALKLILI